MQFLVVLGDAPPHNSPAPTVAPNCGNRPPADVGITSDSEIAGLNANDITLLMIHFSTAVNIPIACYNELTGATGGTAVESGGDLSGEIISRIQAAAAHIDTVNLLVSGQCPPVGLSFSPAPPYGPLHCPRRHPVRRDHQRGAGPAGCLLLGVTAVVDVRRERSNTST